MKLPLVTPIYKDTVFSWTYSSGLVNQTGMIYIDNLEYQITSGMLQSLYLLRMHNPEGYADNVTMNPYGPFYYYYHKDHLGNNREVWKAAYSINGTVTPAAVVQQTSYYQSGLPWSDGSGVSAQPYKYNGKEFVEMHGLDTYDYGARGYYPALGRFMTVDPMAEKRPWESPYVYCGNNPVNRVDPTGMIWDDQNAADNLKKKADEKILKLNEINNKLTESLTTLNYTEDQKTDIQNLISGSTDRIADLSQSKNDIDQLGNDKDHTYVINDQGGGTLGNVTLKSDGKISINAPKTELAFHEIKHVTQSLNSRGLIFRGGNLQNDGLTRTERIKNEVQAYQFQFSFSGSIPEFGTIYGPRAITPAMVGNMKKPDGSLMYPY